MTPLDAWFAHATSVNAPGPIQHTKTPDFMCGKTFRTMCKDKYYDNAPQMLLFWSLLKYDRVHQIGLAESSTDQEGYALFKAPLNPGAKVPSADLSHYGTGRGLTLGSTYAQVLALYGGPVKHGDRFVTSYGADDVETIGGKREVQPETITLVIDHGRVSSIAIDIEIYEGD